MNTQTAYKYTLDPSPRKFHCPECGKRRFVRYLDATTGDYLPERFGRCDRKENCAYHLKPTTDNRQQREPAPDWRLRKPIQEVSLIDYDTFSATRGNYQDNNFVRFLRRVFATETVNKLISLYHLGTGSHGEVIFWQIDLNGQVRSGKVMQYDPDTGRRAKYMSWAHSDIERFKLKQCLFGMHLLRDHREGMPIALVESEKTAVISQGYFPEITWIATGGAHGLNADKLRPLAGHILWVLPDSGKLTEWTAKMQEIQQEVFFDRVEIADFIELQAKGEDFADRLLKLDYFDFKDYSIIQNHRS